ncbi:putative transmembrane pheromone receptor [Amanita muscaria]
MADPTYPIYPAFALIGFVLVLIPLPWHFQAWNSGTCLFMIWTALGCLNFFINSIIWHNNVVDWAPIWCDISTRLSIGVSVAIPAASLCINRRLYKIASCTTAPMTPAQKRRTVLIDLLIGLGIPALQMPLQFVVQGHRYDIWEDVGCYPITVNTPLAYPLSFLWPNVIGLVSAVYSILTVRAFLRRRAEFSQILYCNTALSPNRYLRLMLLATLEIVFNVPISSYDLYLNATKVRIYPWNSWSDVHFDWYNINAYPAFLWRSDNSVVATLELTRWSPIICALVFFIFFGFAQEARKNYSVILSSVTKRLNFTFLYPNRDESFPSFKSAMRSDLLPVYASKLTTKGNSTSIYPDTATRKPQSSHSSIWKLDIAPTSPSSSPFTA